MAWTSGYITDVTYPAFFYKDMQPLWLAATAAFAGLEAPDFTQAFTALELGCGTGTNVLVAAACHPEAQFTGVDFNPDHIAQAQAAAKASNLQNVTFLHADFETFAQNNGANFDLITCHGVWSWIAPNLQETILNIISNRLKEKGLFYLHYMCHPGSTELVPLQHMLSLCAHYIPGPSTRKARTGLSLLHRIAETGQFAHRPELQRHLDNWAKQNPDDLAHEFLSDHWQPQHSVDVHQTMAQAGLSFIASADAFNNLDTSLSIPRNMQSLIRQTQVPALAEALKDLARNAHQRIDLFQKAPQALEETAFLSRIGQLHVCLTTSAGPTAPYIAKTPIGPVTAPAELVTPIMQRLRQGPACVAELAHMPAYQGNWANLLQTLQFLMMDAHVLPCLPHPPQNTAPISALQAWLKEHGLPLILLPASGSAIPA